MARGDLTDQAWQRIEPHLPPQNPKRPGGRYREHRQVIDGILWTIRTGRTGAPWRDLPERYGPWQTCYDRFCRWQKDGTWQKVLQAQQGQAESGRLPGGAVEAVGWDGCAADSTSIRVHPHGAGARKARAKKGAPEPARRRVTRKRRVSAAAAGG